MRDYALSLHNVQSFVSEIQEELAGTQLLLVTTSDPSTGKWGMARLWRSWMGTTGKWMAQQGATMPLCLKADGSHYGSRPFNAEDAHELFTARWLGVDAEGIRLSWAKQGHDGMRPATRGERFIALQRHEEWAGDRGVILFKPRDSEYMQIEREQNA